MLRIISYVSLYITLSSLPHNNLKHSSDCVYALYIISGPQHWLSRTYIPSLPNPVPRSLMTQDSQNKDRISSHGQGPTGAANGIELLAGRVGASASGLFQSSIAGPSAGAVTGTLASLNVEGDKGASSSNSGNFGEASSSASLSSIPDTHRIAGPSSTDESFRSGPARSANGTRAIQAEFDDFEAGSLESSLAPSLPENAHAPPQINHSDCSSGKQVPGPSAAIEKSTQQATLHPQSQDANEIDGAAVVALLSDPGFTTDEDPANLVTFDPGEDGREPRLGIHRNHRTHDTSDSLALIPDFDSSGKSSLPSSSYQELDHVLGSESFPDTESGDLKPWIDILDKYQDEVWGDMLPLVQEAREEIKVANASNQGAQLDRPAIRRLGMLLRHIKYPLG